MHKILKISRISEMKIEMPGFVAVRKDTTILEETTVAVPENKSVFWRRLLLWSVLYAVFYALKIWLIQLIQV